MSDECSGSICFFHLLYDGMSQCSRLFAGSAPRAGYFVVKPLVLLMSAIDICRGAYDGTKSRSTKLHIRQLPCIVTNST